jgi:uncharacterized protein (TIGR00288 family)
VNVCSSSETLVDNIMSTPFTRAPHIEGPSGPPHPSHAPNAALLIDFDNVTMGMRSDLSKELKTLLNSDIIKGKVTVQRAYADWRRYPQYIVPLSEASIDLIFAPAYGSSKKNATDIRMAIDGMELVFTRPEIGTYILLTGDSDFSSLVLKLKEYGKYVIGVGIQESSSDILVQNCDEYYSYTSLSGLRKTSDGAATGTQDPWVLVERAVEQMANRNDVMRSDRLKQVMLEIDPGFDEKSYGFSKFSRFLTEAAQKGILSLKKMENGQYEVSRSGGARDRDRDRSRGRGGRKEKDEGRKEESRRTPTRTESGRGPAGRPAREAKPEPDPQEEPAPTAGAPAGDDPLRASYHLLREAIRDLLEDHDSDAVRDSDVKRRMLAIRSGFDEAELGFSKFSRFLRQAHDHEVVELMKGENGQYHVRLRDGAPARGTPPATTPSEGTAPREEAQAPAARRRGEAPPAEERKASPSRGLRPRLSTRRRAGEPEGPPPLFEGQVIGTGRSGGPEPRAGEEPQRTAPAARAPSSDPGEVLDPAELKLPTGRDSVIKYLSNSYRGVGLKTAETLVDELGDSLFRILQTDPDRVEKVLPPSRAERVLEGWREDFARRRARLAGEERGGRTPSDGDAGTDAGPRRSGEGEGDEPSGGRRGRRTRAGGRSSR